MQRSIGTLIFEGQSLNLEFDVEIQAGQVKNRANRISLTQDTSPILFFENVHKVISNSSNELGVFILHGSLAKLHQKTNRRKN